MVDDRIKSISYEVKERRRAEQVDKIGRAIHAAKRVGGPWGPACMKVKDRVIKEFRIPLGNDDFEPVEYDYNSGEYECECASMASHLVELMEREA